MAKKKRPRNWKEALNQMESPQVHVMWDLNAQMTALKAQVPLLRPLDQEDWTEELRALLPDGMRWSKAKRFVLNFNFVENFEVQAMNQVMIHRFLYCRWEYLPEEEVSAVLVCHQKPGPELLAKLGFVASAAPGVYCNSTQLNETMELIIPQELGSGKHNDTFKEFAIIELVKALVNKPNAAAEALLPQMPYKLETQTVGVRPDLGDPEDES